MTMISLAWHQVGIGRAKQARTAKSPAVRVRVMGRGSLVRGAAPRASRRLRRLRLQADVFHLEIVEQRLEKAGLLDRQIAAGLQLKCLEQVDDLARSLQIDLGLLGEGVRHLTEIRRRRRRQVQDQVLEMRGSDLRLPGLGRALLRWLDDWTRRPITTLRPGGSSRRRDERRTLL